MKSIGFFPNVTVYYLHFGYKLMIEVMENAGNVLQSCDIHICKKFGEHEKYDK